MSENQHDVELWVFVSKGCPHCPEAERLAKILAKEYNIGFVKYRTQTSDGKKMAKEYDVMGTPTILVWQDDNLFSRIVGTPSRSKLETTIKKALGIKTGFLSGLFG